MSFEYTLASKDPTRYGYIQSYFEHPGSDYATMTVTSLVTQCNIRVLKPGDYITLNYNKYSFTKDYTNLNYDTFASMLNFLIAGSGILIELDQCNRIVIKANIMFLLSDASYNVRLLMGLHPYDKLNIYGLNITIPTVGFMLSTPVLYLKCNIGAKCFKNTLTSNNIQNTKIAMRITNSFSANYPIVTNNMDFSVNVASTDISDVEFTLVDANMKEIELLSPMYLSVSIKRIDEERRIMSGNAETMKWMNIQKNEEAKNYYTEMKKYEIFSNMRSDASNQLIGRNLK